MDLQNFRSWVKENVRDITKVFKEIDMVNSSTTVDIFKSKEDTS
jgi:hypothetical protein